MELFFVKRVNDRTVYMLEEIGITLVTNWGLITSSEGKVILIEVYASRLY